MSGRYPTPGKVIPELKMAFWERMFTTRHDADFWGPYLTSVFPNLDSNGTVPQHRTALRTRFKTVRDIRNRIGHHEHITDIMRFDLQECFDVMMDVLRWRSTELHEWASSIENVQAVLDARPRAAPRHHS